MRLTYAALAATCLAVVLVASLIAATLLGGAQSPPTTASGSAARSGPGATCTLDADASSAGCGAILLGTLGAGRTSEAFGVSGSLVVGSSTMGGPDQNGIAGPTRHAFAIDLGAPSPHMVDLGTLGGDDSRASAVSGTLVVGASSARASRTHAFAIDVAAASSGMVDLGTLGGPSSEAVAVDGRVVVGSSQTSPDAESRVRHGFAYDLAAADPHMIDLGTLGAGETSDSVAVSGSIVVGISTFGAGDEQRGGPKPHHGFAYDLAAPDPHMIDLGTLGGPSSDALAVDGTVVVGSSVTDDGATHAFAYDLAAPVPHMIDLGVPGRDSRAEAIAGALVAGVSTDADGTSRVFTDDLSVADPSPVIIGTLDARGVVRAIAGPFVVGSTQGWTNGGAEPCYLDQGGCERGGVFAYDVAAEAAQRVPLALADQGTYGVARAADTRYIVGSARANGGPRCPEGPLSQPVGCTVAVAWPLDAGRSGPRATDATPATAPLVGSARAIRGSVATGASAVALRGTIVTACDTAGDARYAGSTGPDGANTITVPDGRYRVGFLHDVRRETASGWRSDGGGP